MTPEERASKLWDDTVLCDGHQDFVPIVAAAIRDAVEEVRSEARAALEPFARLAGTHSARLVPPKELVDARDAYLALGGKLE